MKDLFNRIGIKPNNLEFYKLAFTHSSYMNEKDVKDDYERLEFLGDAVLELVVSDYLYNNFDKEEGEMTKLRASYVCENACSTYASSLDFSKYIKVSHGEEKEGGRYKKVILADIFEAFMGAVYLDLGFDTVKKVILDIVVPYILDKNVTFFSDYKSALQECMQTEQRTVHYELVNEHGPAHRKVFTMEVVIDGIVYGKGIGGSKKDAEQEAAKDALSKLASID